MTCDRSVEILLKVALNTIKLKNNDNANILFCLLNRSIGSIAGAVIGSLIGLAILIVIVVVLCGACKHSGNRGTVVQPVNTTTNTVIHTVPMNQRK